MLWKAMATVLIDVWPNFQASAPKLLFTDSEIGFVPDAHRSCFWFKHMGWAIKWVQFIYWNPRRERELNCGFGKLVSLKYPTHRWPRFSYCCVSYWSFTFLWTASMPSLPFLCPIYFFPVEQCDQSCCGQNSITQTTYIQLFRASMPFKATHTVHSSSAILTEYNRDRSRSSKASIAQRNSKSVYIVACMRTRIRWATSCFCLDTRMQWWNMYVENFPHFFNPSIRRRLMAKRELEQAINAPSINSYGGLF